MKTKVLAVVANNLQGFLRLKYQPHLAPLVSTQKVTYRKSGFPQMDEKAKRRGQRGVGKRSEKIMDRSEDKEAEWNKTRE